jgi:hypothetical protein
MNETTETTEAIEAMDEVKIKRKVSEVLRSCQIRFDSGFIDVGGGSNPSRMEVETRKKRY